MLFANWTEILVHGSIWKETAYKNMVKERPWDFYTYLCADAWDQLSIIML